MPGPTDEGRHYRQRGGWSPRQREVLNLLVRGYTNGQIAEALGMTLDGAKWHVSEIITRLGVESREEAADWWRQQRGLRGRLRSYRHAFGVALMARWAGGTAAAAAVAGAIIMTAVVLAGDTTSEPAADTTVPEPTGIPWTLTAESQRQRFAGFDAPGTVKVAPTGELVVADRGAGEVIALDADSGNRRTLLDNLPPASDEGQGLRSAAMNADGVTCAVVRGSAEQGHAEVVCSNGHTVAIDAETDGASTGAGDYDIVTDGDDGWYVADPVGEQILQIHDVARGTIGVVATLPEPPLALSNAPGEGLRLVVALSDNSLISVEGGQAGGHARPTATGIPDLAGVSISEGGYILLGHDKRIGGAFAWDLGREQTWTLPLERASGIAVLVNGRRAAVVGEGSPNVFVVPLE